MFILPNPGFLTHPGPCTHPICQPSYIMPLYNTCTPLPFRLNKILQFLYCRILMTGTKRLFLYQESQWSKEAKTTFTSCPSWKLWNHYPQGFLHHYWIPTLPGWYRIEGSRGAPPGIHHGESGHGILAGSINL